jgi:tripartite-type tricarboxylate transporter receptor subunit TctC
MDRRRFLLASFSAAGSTLFSNTSSGQTWPSRFVKIVVPFTAAGANDLIARILGSALSESLGQQVVVENKPGAGGNLGIESVARAEADGYTLLLTPIAMAVNCFLYRSIAYDPVADFAPITLICTQPNLMVVPNSSPAHSVSAFVSLAKRMYGSYLMLLPALDRHCTCAANFSSRWQVST